MVKNSCDYINEGFNGEDITEKNTFTANNV